MLEIRPFRGWRYRLDDTTSLGDVVALPYDRIKDDLQQELLKRHPKNIVRLIKPPAEDDQHAETDPYKRANLLWEQWRKEGTLVQDEQPAFTIYTQQGPLPGGGEFVRHVTQVALRLNGYTSDGVRRHEQTLAKPLSDRLDLMRSTKANFGQIFALYPDDDQSAWKLIEAALQAAPDAVMTDAEGIRHSIRVVTDGEWHAAFSAALKDRYLIIADGHHRYETANRYQQERLAEGDSDDAGFNYTMMSIGGMSHPGVQILATHRVLRRCPLSEAETESRLASMFTLEPVADFAALKAQGTTQPGVFGWHTPSGRNLLLRLKDDAWSQLPGSEAIPETERALDVVRLHRLIVEHAIGFTEEEVREEQVLSYVRLPEDGLAMVKDGAAGLFLLSPTTISQVQEMTELGKVMPQKATDFFPKVWSGFTLRDLEEKQELLLGKRRGRG